MSSRVRALNLLVVAEEGAGVELLKQIHAGPHRVSAVLTTPPDGAATVAATPWNFAQRLGYPTVPASAIRDPATAGLIREARVDLLLNVHSLFVIPEAVLAAPRIGGFNMHPGPLPAYAGLNAPSWALYRDEILHGVTIHRMEPGIDTGAIAYQTLFPIQDRDSGRSVSVRCVLEGLAGIEQLLADAAEDPASIPRREQDRSRRSYFGREVPQGGAIQWARPAREVFNFVRAACFHPFPSPWGSPSAGLDGGSIGILRAALTGEPADEPPGTVGTSEGRSVRVACSDDWLRVELIVDGGHRSDPSAVLRRGDRLGDGPPGR